jgi:hypothetical protein
LRLVLHPPRILKRAIYLAAVSAVLTALFLQMSIAQAAEWLPSTDDDSAFFSNLIEGNGGIERIWAVDDGEKVRKDDLQHPLAESPQNEVWDGSKIALFGARNEIIAFQLILQAGDSGARQVNVKCTELSQGAYQIPGSDAGSADPFDYRGKSIELFTEHYLFIKERSQGDTSWTEASQPAEYYLGWVPDALIPFAAPPGLGGAPFDIPARSNQGVWVDIYIPRDAPQGILTGEALVSAAGGLTHRIPIELQVYPFALSDETHFHNMFAIEPTDIARRHGVEVDSDEYYEIETRYHQMAHRHRLDLVQAVRNLSQIRRYHNRYLTGALYQRKYGYEGPGEGVGNRMFSIGLYGALPMEYGGSPQNWSKDSWWAGSDAWATWFAENAPEVSIHKYLSPDEPRSESELRAIKAQADWSHNNPGIGSTIPTFVTHWIDSDYKGYVDIWSTSANHAMSGTYPGTIASSVQSELEAGSRWGVYNGYRPATGSPLIDTDAVDFRVIPWIGWKYKLDHYFYWMTTYWTDYTKGSKAWNLFANPMTMYGTGNGAGTLFYPGQDFLYVEEDRGLPGPIASIRMKNWRRGMQDYEYLWLASTMGIESEIDPIVDQIVPAALWDVNLKSPVSWPLHGYQFEAIRKAVAELIASHTSMRSPAETMVSKPTPTDLNPEHPYYADLNLVYQMDYIAGCNQDPPQICPDDVITRAEAAVLFGKAIYGANTVLDMPSEQVFVDLPLIGEDSWATPWATALLLNGFVSGCSEQPLEFCPRAFMPRVDIAVLALRLKYGPDYRPPLPKGIFRDVSTRWWGSAWVEAAYEEGYLAPCDTINGIRFCPYGTLSRGEAAKILVQSLGLTLP